jgi:acyl-CoA hydrolase
LEAHAENRPFNIISDVARCINRGGHQFVAGPGARFGETLRLLEDSSGIEIAVFILVRITTDARLKDLYPDARYQSLHSRMHLPVLK